MKCPFCAYPDTQVIETRVTEVADSVRRRRQCSACEKRFTTYERADIAFPLIVKKDGRRVDYDRRKLLASMQLALRKRPVSADTLAQTIENIEAQLLHLGQREVPSQQLGEWLMQALWTLDNVAYIRFASVYRNFESAGEFKAWAENITPPTHPSPAKKTGQ
jgi:transcriptional repressor NrdR